MSLEKLPPHVRHATPGPAITLAHAGAALHLGAHTPTAGAPTASVDRPAIAHIVGGAPSRIVLRAGRGIGVVY
jgi:hypothetical protein